MIFGLIAPGCSQQQQTIHEVKSSSPKEWVFDRPSIESLRQSKKKVFAHYFSPFPTKISNRPEENDYYTNGYLSPTGEKNKHIKYGGFLRQRPLPSTPRPEENWRELNYQDEILKAKALGLDGFTYDILGYEGTHWKRLIEILDAAQKVAPDFKIVLMPDMQAAYKSKPEQLVPSLLKVIHHPSVYRDDKNRFVLSPYNAQRQSPQWWKNVIAEFKGHGIDVMFIPVFQAWWKYADGFAPISDGFSDWGAANPHEIMKGSRKLSPQRSHDYGKIWMAPIRPQDFRPKSYYASESENSLLYRTMWDVAIKGNAEWAQIVTWNDYSEGTEIAPSSETNRGFYDLTAYYTTWFKTGQKPKVVRDGLYYFYRIQPTKIDVKLEKQHKNFKIKGKASNQIECLGFLKEDGFLQIEIAGKTYTQEAKAGMTSFKIPLTEGSPVFKILRSGEEVLKLNGQREIRFSGFEYQDFLYRSKGIVEGN